MVGLITFQLQPTLRLPERICTRFYAFKIVSLKGCILSKKICIIIISALYIIQRKAKIFELCVREIETIYVS